MKVNSNLYLILVSVVCNKPTMQVQLETGKTGRIKRIRIIIRTTVVMVVAVEVVIQLLKVELLRMEVAEQAAIYAVRKGMLKPVTVLIIKTSSEQNKS